MDRAVLINIFHRVVPAGSLRVASAIERSGIADEAESIGGALRIVGGEHVSLQRLLAPKFERAVGFVANTGVSLAVEGLARAVRVAVGGLIGQGHTVIFEQRRRAVRKLARKRVEGGFDLADRQPAAADPLLDLQAHIRPLERARVERGDRLTGILRGPDAVLQRLRISGAQRNAVVLVRIADIDGSEESDAIPGQTVRDRVLDAAYIEVCRMRGCCKAGKRDCKR